MSALDGLAPYARLQIREIHFRELSCDITGIDGFGNRRTFRQLDSPQDLLVRLREYNLNLHISVPHGS